MMYSNNLEFPRLEFDAMKYLQEFYEAFCACEPSPGTILSF